ncbi:MAG: hypothetical protein E6G19_01085 [Actinobacteria bacterium]|nr:MAG: hypothetical protein E6G19_01085 [Actinomycetota bacterium]
MIAWLRDRRAILAVAVGSRMLVLAAAAADHVLHWPKGPPPVHGASTAHTLSILSYWDGVWYRTVAEQGYLLIPGRQSDPAFFPLFPIILRGLQGFGLSFLTTGILVANAAFVIGILAFYELSRRLVPIDLARTSALFAALFPMSFVFSMTYPESLVFAALALALLLALQGRWTLSALAGAAAALGRPEAMFFALPLAAIAIGNARATGRLASGRAIGAAFAPVASIATFPLYLGWALDNPTAWSGAQQAWGRSFSLDGIVRAIQQLFARGSTPWLWRDVAFCLIYLALLVAARRIGISWPWLVASTALILLPLTSGTFMSDSRFGVLALPVYWGAAALTRRRIVRLPALVLCAGLLVAGTMTIPLANP